MWLSCENVCSCFKIFASFRQRKFKNAEKHDWGLSNGGFVEALYFWCQACRTSLYTDIQFHKTKELLKRNPLCKEHERTPLWIFSLRGFSTSPSKSKLYWYQYHTLLWVVWSTSLPSFPPLSSQLIKPSDSLWRGFISSMMYVQSRKQWSLFKLVFHLFSDSNPTRIF